MSQLSQFVSGGFDIAYSVEIDPELPPEGELAGRRVHLQARRGSEDNPVVVRVTPQSGRPWLGTASIRGGFMCAATPNPHVMFVPAGWSEVGGTLIDVREPDAAVDLDFYMPEVVPDMTNELLLVTDSSRIGVIDAGGLRWTWSEDFFYDLYVVRVEAGRIIVGSDSPSYSEKILDALSGQLVELEWVEPDRAAVIEGAPATNPKRWRWPWR